MNKTSRKDNVSKNIVVSLGSRVFLLALTFLVRTIFIRTLGDEYTGINGLYSNILGILNIAELGMGNVLVFELYKPLRDKDEEKIKELIKFFKRTYSIIFCVVLAGGICVLPFLKYVVNSSLDTFHLYIYYILYLVNSAASYVVVYRTTVITADQKVYVNNLTDVICTFVMYIVQIVYLLIKKDFLGYLIIQVAFTIVKNLLLDAIAKKLYPYLKEDCATSITEKEKNNIYNNVRATFISQISNTMLNSTDNIIISMMLGTIYVGYYSNYYILITYINTISYLITNSLEPSIGNLNAEENKSKTFDVYKKLNFLMMLFYTICTAGFICVIQDFIIVWIGEEHLQSFSLVLAIIFTFYISHSTTMATIFIRTMGLFKENQSIFFIMALINVVLSIIFGKFMGVTGIILATGLSNLLTVFWFEGVLLYKRLDKSITDYFLMQIKYLSIVIISVSIAYNICKLIKLNFYIGIIAKGLVSIFVSLLVYLISSFNTEEYKWVIASLSEKINKKGAKNE